MNEWGDFIAKVGLPTALVVYFMWRDSKRDERANKKEDEIQAAFKALNERQFDLTTKCIEAVTTSNELKRELKQVIDHMCAGDLKLPERRKSAGYPTIDN